MQNPPETAYSRPDTWAKRGALLLLAGIAATITAFVVPALGGTASPVLWVATLAAGLGLTVILLSLLAGARSRSRLVTAYLEANQ